MTKPSTRKASAADITVRKQASQLRPFHFQPGQSGNPSGRPKGSRNALSEAFIAALADDFAQHGVTVIATVRKEKPAEYLKVVASLVPRDVNVKTPGVDEMTDEELLTALQQIKIVAALLTTEPAKTH